MKTLKFRYCLVIIVLTILVSCSSEKKEEEIIRPVEAIMVGDSQNTNARTFSGIAKASGETALSFRIPGTIYSIPVEKGQKIYKGDLLARLDTKDEELKVKQAEAGVVEAKAILKQAKAEFERAIALYEANNISKSELDRREADYLSSKAKLEAAEKVLSINERNLGYCSIYAPNDGYVVDTVPDEFQVINTGDTVIVFAADEPMEVDLGVPETLINRIRVGQKAKVKFDFLDNQEIEAFVSEVGVMADRSTTFPIKVKFIEKDYRLRQGMACDVILDFGKQSNSDLMVIPSSAIFGDISGKKFVWVYEEDNSTVTKRSVEIGNLASNGVYIKNGLEIGEIIITKGVNTIDEGMKVKLL